MDREFKSKPLTGRTVLVCLVAFFAVVIGVNLLMAKLAIATMPGTDVDSAYRASLAYNAEIKAAGEQEKRAWKVKADVTYRNGLAELRITAKDAQDRPLSNLDFHARLERPVTQGADHEVLLEPKGNGVYAAGIERIKDGQWDLILIAESKDRRLFLSRSRLVFSE